MGYKYCYLTPIILLNSINSFAQLNSSKYCYVIPKILFCIQVNCYKYFSQNFLFRHSGMVPSIAMYEFN